MRRMKDRTREELKELKEASRAAKKALAEWRRQYVVDGMSQLMYDYDLEEVEQMVKLLQLKLRNQQSTSV